MQSISQAARGLYKNETAGTRPPKLKRILVIAALAIRPPAPPSAINRLTLDQFPQPEGER